MINPWTSRNPFLSFWLSAANTAAAAQRSAFEAELGRQQSELTREWMRLWTDAWFFWLPRGRR
jgi:hypothetical protein